MDRHSVCHGAFNMDSTLQGGRDISMKTRSFTWLTVLAVAGMAHAQAPAGKSVADPPKIDFSTVDKDANGKLSKEEALTVVELDASFDKLDTDRDGFVT